MNEATDDESAENLFGDPWVFLRSVLSRGASIEADTRASGRTSERHEARLDAAASVLYAIPKPHLKPKGEQK